MKYSIVIVLILIFSGLFAQEKYYEWNDMLSKYVDDNGGVNYTEWKKDKKNLDAFVSKLSKNNLKFSSTKEEMSFWMNLYNAATIQKVLEYYPVNSIMNIKKGKIWDEKFIVVQNKYLSLNQIENELLRDKFKDPRIHFGINCAAISCPKLYNKAFTSENLEVSLNNLTKEFVNKATLVKSNYVELSKIFEWYKDDFTQNGSLIDFINKYSNEKVPQGYEIKFSEYNWDLNKKKE